MTKLDVTVVVCTYNRAEMLRTALASLQRLEAEGLLEYEILVIDNSSTDHTQEVIEQARSEMDIRIRSVVESQQGVCFARNRGITEARGAWVAFFDDDQLADEAWLVELWRMAERKKTRCVGGAVQLLLPDSCPPERRQAYGRLLGLSGQQPSEFQYHARQAPGAGNLMLHHSVFEEIGVFDATLTEAGEDSDLFQRMEAAGIGGWYTPRAIVKHTMPEYRVSTEYLKWRSLRQGWSLAKNDQNRSGTIGMLFSLAARLAYTYVLNLPAIVWRVLSRSTDHLLLHRCRIWKTNGYLRSALRLVAPTAFAQRSFHDRLDFRAERQIFAGH